ncbi:MAG: DUF58 domain-containing protein [Spirochaetales bacterium]|nr:DUF58 domain-containing protein [Spirochaetales bacterium]
MISFLLTFIQYLILKRQKTKLRMYLPSGSVEAGTTVEIRTEAPSFFILPAMSVKEEVNFFWKNRKLHGKVICRSYDKSETIHLLAGSRGNYTNAKAFFSISDPAAFFRFRTGHTEISTLKVRSCPLYSERLPIVSGSGGDAPGRVRRIKRSDELLEVRPYIPGDDLGRINWKSYAHTGDLLLRIGEQLPDPQDRILIIADLSGDVEKILGAEKSSCYLDYVVSVLAGISQTLFDSGKSVSVLISNGQIKEAEALDYTAALWWEPFRAADKVAEFGKCGVLVLSSPYSDSAINICNTAVRFGLPVSALVPVPVPEQKKYTPSLLKKILFVSDNKNQTLPESLSSDAVEFCRKLSTLKGVKSAYVI